MPARFSLTATRAHALAWAVVVLGAALRAPGCFAYWANPDEGIFYEVAIQGNAALGAGSAHPPAFYWLARGLGLLTSDLSLLRLLSTAAGCAAIFGLFRLGLALRGPGVGLVAALLLAVSPAAIEQSQLLRPYMLQTAWLVGAEWCLVAALRQGSWRAWGGHGALLTLAVLTHYSSYLLVAAHLVAAALWWALGPGRGQVRRWAASYAPVVAAMVLLYATHIRPSLQGSALQREAQRTWLAPYFPSGLGEAWDLGLGVLRYLYGPREGGLALLVIGGLVLALRRRRGVWLHQGLLTLALFGVALAAAALRQYPLGGLRHSSYLAPFVHLAVAAAVVPCLRPAGWPGAAGALVAALALLLPGPLNLALGAPEERPAGFDEQPLRVDDVQPLLAALPQGPGLVVMSRQTHYVLVPALGATEPPRIADDWGWLTFRWGEKRVLVNTLWDMTVFGEPGRPEDLVTFMARAQRELPELRIPEQERVWIVSAGWTRSLAEQLVALDRRLPPSAQRIDASRALVAPALIAFPYDLRALLASR